MRNLIKIFLAILLVFTNLLTGQNPTEEITGNWSGILKIKEMKLNIIFNLSQNTKGDFIASMDIVEQGVKNIKADKVIYTGNKLHLYFNKLRSGFDGEISKDRKILNGKWKLPGMTVPLELKKINRD